MCFSCHYLNPLQNATILKKCFLLKELNCGPSNDKFMSKRGDIKTQPAT